ncbi:MAG: hypothetical protein FJZ47_17630 [Candidatus Tectomicrobia bacterium]|uniref:Uncharacterized protein n=1 Tax=Tectimicrobiota bacterium TaxID=2528274 RepID=A0A938B3Q7_UNCTE|nr:hypothetical protein [Candidatus Tectomicrobia bacterium]
MDSSSAFPEPQPGTKAFQRLQQAQLEREAYPRRQWAEAREAYEGMAQRLTAGVGPWSYDPALYTITHASRRYQIDLETVTTPAELLDILLQIATKNAGKSTSLADLVALLEAISEELFQSPLRALFCPGGETRTVQWPRAQGIAANEDEATWGEGRENGF